MQARIKPSKTCNEEGLGIDFEYTAPGMPQQNGHVEHKFATLFNQVCTMLKGGKFTTYQRNCPWTEAAKTATLLQNNLITPNRNPSPFQNFFVKGKKSILTSMQKFGEICIATYKDNTHQAKLANCGTPSIWVGYAENHPTGKYKMFNPKAKKIILTRDMTFLQKFYCEYTQVEKPVVVTSSYEGSDEEEKLKRVSLVSNNDSLDIVSDSNSDSSDEDFKNNEDNFFDKKNDQVKITLQTIINPKVV